MSKTMQAHLIHNLLIVQCLLEIDARSLRKSHDSSTQKKKNLKTTRA